MDEWKTITQMGDNIHKSIDRYPIARKLINTWRSLWDSRLVELAINLTISHLFNYLLSWTAALGPVVFSATAADWWALELYDGVMKQLHQVGVATTRTKTDDRTRRLYPTAVKMRLRAFNFLYTHDTRHEWPECESFYEAPRERRAFRQSRKMRDLS